MDIKSNTNQDQIDQKPVEQKQPINSEPVDQITVPENTPETESIPETQTPPETTVLTEKPPQIETPSEPPRPEISSEPEPEPQPQSTPEPQTQPEASLQPEIESQPQPEIQNQPEITPQPEPEIPPQSAPEKYQDILDQYAASRTENIAPPIESPLTAKNPDFSSEEPRLTPEPQETVPNLASFNPNPEAPQNNIFKISFITSLIIFIFTSTVLAFVYLKSKSVSTTSSTPPSTTTVVQTTPTIAPQTGICVLNEKTYQIGESFAAADGCNTCTCTAPNNISCTERECLATPAATKSAVNSTKTATSSSIAKDWKTYNNSTYKFSIQYPSNWTTENVQIDQNTPEILKMFLTPQKQENCGGSPTGNGVMCLDKVIVSIDKNKNELDQVINTPEVKNLVITKGEKGKIYKFNLISAYDGSSAKTLCFIFDNEKVLWITGSYLNKTEEGIFNQIGESVKFY